MSSTTVEPGAAGPKTNRIGLTVIEYKGGKTTLCAGCGHNAISERIIEAMYEMGVEPEFVIKPSGIGCSSKTPAYFLSRSHSFNAVHGRMPSVATGALLANRKLVCIGVSGDGDTASIGVGQFVHLMRRNLPIIYIIEDNGVYGLTKGQFRSEISGRRKLSFGEAVNAVVLDDVDDGQITAHQMDELSDAECRRILRRRSRQCKPACDSQAGHRWPQTAYVHVPR